MNQIFLISYTNTIHKALLNYVCNVEFIIHCYSHFRCTTNRVCVSPGLFYDAVCQVESMGVVWIQPKIIE